MANSTFQQRMSSVASAAKVTVAAAFDAAQIASMAEDAAHQDSPEELASARLVFDAIEVALEAAAEASSVADRAAGIRHFHNL